MCDKSECDVSVSVSVCGCTSEWECVRMHVYDHLSKQKKRPREINTRAVESKNKDNGQNRECTHTATYFAVVSQLPLASRLAEGQKSRHEIASSCAASLAVVPCARSQL
jgi:hypothetical protein